MIRSQDIAHKLNNENITLNLPACFDLYNISSHAGCEKIARDNGEFWSIYVNGVKKTWIGREFIAYIDGQSQQPESYLADMSEEDREKFKDIHCDCD